MTNAMLIHPDDTGAVATAALSKGRDATYASGGKEITIKALDDIPIYHKIAVISVKKGGGVLKYGELIGLATADIEVGSHVHTHNLSDFSPKAGDER
jgi:altronate dehydratase